MQCTMRALQPRVGVLLMPRCPTTLLSRASPFSKDTLPSRGDSQLNSTRGIRHTIAKCRWLMKNNRLAPARFRRGARVKICRIGPVCSNGISGFENAGRQVCCAPSCSVCGGATCTANGGRTRCCVSPILVAGLFCEDTGAAPCILPGINAAGVPA